MAVETLFVENVAGLKEQLRLTGAAASDALAILDGEISRARIESFDRLGTARVNEILTYLRTDNPSNVNEIALKRAELMEVNQVRRGLLTRLKMFWMDSSAATEQAFNQEGFTREVDGRDMQHELDRLRAEIEEAYLYLEAASTDDKGILFAEAVTPDAANVNKPFDTIKPFNLFQ